MLQYVTAVQAYNNQSPDQYKIHKLYVLFLSEQRYHLQVGNNIHPVLLYYRIQSQNYNHALHDA